MWTRSQTSWHHGAGINFYEPGLRDEANPTQYRFKDSRGVDVWTEGRLSLLPAMDQPLSSAATWAVCGAVTPDGADAYFARSDTGVHRVGSSTGVAPVVTYTLAGARMCPAGQVVLVGSNAGIYSVPLTGTMAATLLVTQGGAGDLCQPWWVKSRIIVTRTNELHQTTLAGGMLDSSSLHYAHPDSNWTWTGVTETPDAILASGYSGGTSSIYAFTLSEDSGGSVPKLSQPFVVAELPPGEEVLTIQSYLGKYLGIGTTAGVRVGLIGTGGQIQYGPLIVETDSPVRALAARGSFIYAASGSSVIRVGLSAPLDGGLRFPYAYDVEVPSGTITSLAFDGVSDRVVAAVDQVGVFVASDTDCVDTGWLESGDIRYATTIPKSFRTMDVVASTPTGTSVAVSATVNGTANTLVTLANNLPGTGISLGSVPQPQGALGYRLDLVGDGANSPMVDIVAIRAVPLPRKQRLVQYPVLVADEMRDSGNRPFGGRGYAALLLDALEALEQTQQTVTIKDLTRPEQYEATIERVEFTRVEGPRGTGRNFGGTAKVTCKTL